MRRGRCDGARAGVIVVTGRLFADMSAVGELETLLSLASFAYEHPSFVRPEIAEGDALFDGVAAGHPLIRDEKRVTNDVRLGGELRLLIVSGSNMSGKSTLLRTVGINAVLALAGTSVCARSLRVTPMSTCALPLHRDHLFTVAMFGYRSPTATPFGATSSMRASSRSVSAICGSALLADVNSDLENLARAKAAVLPAGDAHSYFIRGSDPCPREEVEDELRKRDRGGSNQSV